MNKLTKTILASSTALLLTISPYSFSAEESGISGRASTADKADYKYKINKLEDRERMADSMENKADRLRESAERKADRMEEKADRIRESAETKADRIEDRADRIRNVDVVRY